MSKAKKSRKGKISDLKGKKLTDKAANQVKGGLNPQPLPPKPPAPKKVY